MTDTEEPLILNVIPLDFEKIKRERRENDEMWRRFDEIVARIEGGDDAA